MSTAGTPTSEDLAMRITSLFPRARNDSRDGDSAESVVPVAAIRRLNDEYLAALRAADTAWLARHLAEDALFLLGDGRRMGKPAFLAKLREEPRRFRSLEARDVNVRVFGPVIQVDADARWELGNGTRGGSRYLDTWVRLDGRWQVISGQGVVGVG